MTATDHGQMLTMGVGLGVGGWGSMEEYEYVRVLATSRVTSILHDCKADPLTEEI